MRLSAGTWTRLGASWDGRGTNFALFSANAQKVELCLFDSQGRRELERIDDYFEAYERELHQRQSRSQNENTKMKSNDRLVAAAAEHQRRRQDQVQRHEIRLIPHLDALLLVAEPAWQTTVTFVQCHELRRTTAKFVTRAPRWFPVPEE